MIKALRLISLFFAVSFTCLMVSCQDDDTVAEVSIVNVLPEEIFPGDEVTIEGENFNSVLFVFINNDQVPFQLDGNQITFNTPTSGGVGNRKVTLVMAAGYTVEMDITLIPRVFPIIEAISTNAAPEGSNVTMVGTSLNNNLQSVTFGGVEANVVSASDTELVVTVPSGLTENSEVPIVVTTEGGEGSPFGKFWVGENLALNEGFELGDGDDFDNWNKFNGADQLTATGESNEAYFGRSLRAVGVGPNPWNTQMASDNLPTQDGVEYTLSILIRGQQGTPGDGGNIRFSTNPNALYSADYTITTEWQQIEWVFTGNVNPARMVLDLGAVEGAVYFIDNVTLVATGL